MFKGALQFNFSLADWDVRNVESMAEMFSHAEAFNQYVGDWKLRKVHSL